MNVTLPRDSGHWPAPGTWVLVRSKERKQPTARVACVDCGQSAPIWFHEIDADGNVTPSLVCPMRGCSWHVTVTLEGWAGVIAGEIVPLGTIRCLDCGRRYPEAPPEWKCEDCGGRVSQKIGEIEA